MGMAVEAVSDLDWRAHAECGRVDPDLFFAPGAREHKIAKSICRECPVRAQCLSYAMEKVIDHGIWGGLTERERRRRRRENAAASRLVSAAS